MTSTRPRAHHAHYAHTHTGMQVGAAARILRQERGEATSGRKRRCRGLEAAALALLLAPLPAAATPVLLQNGSALLEIDPASAAGLTNWTVAGAQHVRQQGFWIRPAGAGSETPFSALDRPAPGAASDLDGDGLDDDLAVTLTDPQGRFDVDLRWSLTGTPFAPVSAGAASTLDLSLVLHNRSDAPLSLELFQFTDVDLLGSFADDTILFSGSPPDTGTVTDATELAVYESVFSIAPDAVEAALFGALLPRLQDTASTALTGDLVATGDVTAAVSWTLTLAAGGSFALDQAQRIDVAGLQAVPEPGALGLVLGGLAFLAASGSGSHARSCHRPRHCRRNCRRGSR